MHSIQTLFCTRSQSLQCLQCLQCSQCTVHRTIQWRVKVIQSLETFSWFSLVELARVVCVNYMHELDVVQL